MKIYVITKGEYSDYHICAVTESKEKAEMLREVFSRNEYEYDKAKIEEYDTENPDIEKILYPMWEIVFNGNGSVKSIDEVTYGVDRYREEIYDQYYVKNGVFVALFAKDKESAIKIAAERRAKYLAEKQGL